MVQRSNARINLPRSQAYPVLSVLRFALTIIHGCRRTATALPNPSTHSEEQRKRGRPGNEATHQHLAHTSLYAPMYSGLIGIYTTVSHKLIRIYMDGLIMLFWFI